MRTSTSTSTSTGTGTGSRTRGVEWAGRALAEVLDGVGEAGGEVGERFPLYAEAETGRWTTTGRGSWAGGFWAGLLWLRARYTGAEADRALASACTGRLTDWADADTSTRGLILWYGTALAVGDTGARDVRTRSAGACLAAMDAELGLLPWGSAFGGPRLLARVDGVPGTVPLLATAGPRGAAAAASHLQRHLSLCLPRTPGRSSCPPGPTRRVPVGGPARSQCPAGAGAGPGCCSHWPTYCTAPPSPSNCRGAQRHWRNNWRPHGRGRGHP